MKNVKWNFGGRAAVGVDTRADGILTEGIREGPPGAAWYPACLSVEMELQCFGIIYYQKLVQFIKGRAHHGLLEETHLQSRCF